MKKGSQIAIILLILAVISLTIVIIAFHLPRKKDTNTYTMPRTEDPGGLDSESSGCPYWSLTGDQVCDDEANTEECHFDHGDCCDVQNDFSLCSDCFCHSAGHLVNDTLTWSNPPNTPAQLSWISWGSTFLNKANWIWRLKQKIHLNFRWLKKSPDFRTLFALMNHFLSFNGISHMSFLQRSCMSIGFIFATLANETFDDIFEVLFSRHILSTKVTSEAFGMVVKAVRSQNEHFIAFDFEVAFVASLDRCCLWVIIDWFRFLKLCAWIFNFQLIKVVHPEVFDDVIGSLDQCCLWIIIDRFKFMNRCAWIFNFKLIMIIINPDVIDDVIDSA